MSALSQCFYFFIVDRAAFEFMDSEVLDIVNNINPDVLAPLPSADISNHPFYILVESHGSDEDHDQAKLERFLEYVMDHGIISDGVLAQSLAQIDEMWKLRESCNPACAASGYVYKYDVSLPIPEFPSFITSIREAVDHNIDDDTQLTVVNWGHVVDGNLHLNIIARDQFEIDPILSNQLEDLVLDQVIERGGSISAEHGLGQYKNKHMPRIKDGLTLNKMRAIKDLFDSNGILNPGKYFPAPV